MACFTATLWNSVLPRKIWSVESLGGQGRHPGPKPSPPSHSQIISIEIVPILSIHNPLDEAMCHWLWPSFLQHKSSGLDLCDLQSHHDVA